MAEHKCQVIQSIRKAQPQARKAITRPKGDKRAISSHVSLFLKHTRGCRASLVTQQLSTVESSSLFSVFTNNSA